MRPALRRLWLRLHRWVGLSLGLVLSLIALTGASLIVLKPLDRTLNPALFAAPAPEMAPVSLDAVRQVLVARYGPQANYTLRPPREFAETLWVHVRGPWDGTAYVDPATARILGERGEYEGAVNFLFELHSSLLLGDAGRPLMASLALAYFFLLASGLALWWPANWKAAWRLRFKAGLTASLFDLHRVGGSALGLLIAISVFSGAYMAWKPLSGFVTMVAGATATLPPKVAQWQGSGASLDAMTSSALGLFPGARVGYVQLPAQPTRPIRFRLKLSDDPHPNGLTSVWFHPGNGEVLAAHRWDQLEAGAHANSYIYPLHTGVLGGVWHEAANALLGLTLACLGATGVCLWLRRRRKAPAQHRSARAQPGAREA